MSEYFKKKYSAKKALILILIALLPIAVTFIFVWFSIDFRKLPTTYKIIGAIGVFVFYYLASRLANDSVSNNSVSAIVKNPNAWSQQYFSSFRNISFLVLAHITICYLIFLSLPKYNGQTILFKAIFAVTLIFGMVIMPFFYLYIIRNLIHKK